MLTLGGRVVMVTLGLSLFLVVSKAIRAEHDCPDEIGDLAMPVRTGTDVAKKRAKIIQAKAPPELLPDAVSDATPVAGQEVIEPALDSRATSSRRQPTSKPQATAFSSRRTSSGPTALVADDVVCSDYDRLEAIWQRHHPALSELMQHLADGRESCPFCGQRCAEKDSQLADLAVRRELKEVDDQTLGYVGRNSPAANEVMSHPLRPGEPAQVILDTQRRLGKSVLEGTEFGGSPELLVQWIRALDDENRRQQALLEEVSHNDVDDTDADRPDVSKQTQVDSLRNACRQLQEAADLLEEQNLFEEADSVRGVADKLRRRSRTVISEIETD